MARDRIIPTPHAYFFSDVGDTVRCNSCEEEAVLSVRTLWSDDYLYYLPRPGWTACAGRTLIERIECPHCKLATAWKPKGFWVNPMVRRVD
jgi:hypothetical protein